MINKEAATFWTAFVASVILIVITIWLGNNDNLPATFSVETWVGIAAVVGMLIGGGIGYFMGDL